MHIRDIMTDLEAMYKDQLGHPHPPVQGLSESDVQRWSALHGWSRSQVFEEIAKCLAVGFHTSELSFAFCDAVVNDLFGPYTDTAKPKSELFWDVYLAFDEGEFYHGNNRDEDPVETYTRPMIARIVDDLERSERTLAG
jgi:hypothetical protein